MGEGDGGAIDVSRQLVTQLEGVALVGRRSRMRT